MKLNKYIFWILGALFFSLDISAQEELSYDSLNTLLSPPIEVQQEPFQAEKIREYIGLVTRAEGDSVVLRWAPSTPSLWVDGQTYGYSIFRLEADEETGLDMDSRVVIRQGDDVIMPWDSTQFVTFGNTRDSLVGLAAQVMYGSSFGAVETEDGIENIYAQAAEFTNRHGMAIFGADRSINAANALGLRYVDYTADPNKSYMYYIYIMKDKEVLADGYMGVRYGRYKDNGQTILGLKTESGDHTINVTWDKVQTGQFSGYIIEKSIDGGNTYVPLTKAPIVFADGPLGDFENYSHQDSVDQNYKTYHYRVKALTPFADFSEYATVTAMAIDLTPPRAPMFETEELLPDYRIKLNWVKLETEPDLAGYKIYKSNVSTGVFTEVTESLLPIEIDTYTTAVLDGEESHYYKISAVDTSGNEQISFPLFTNVPDNKPPSIPVGLIHDIDTLGVVTLGWKMGDEKDLRGYRVYFSNSLTNEFTQLTTKSVDHNYFFDTLQLKTLTETIYYKVQAEDIKYNRSRLSEPMAVKRPDIIPPVTPVFKNPVVTDSTVLLTWIASTSEDVEAHHLYRKKYQSEDEWTLITSLGKSDRTYTDNTAKPEQIYAYSLRAEDDAGLYSDYAFPVKGRVYFNNDIASASGLIATYNKDEDEVDLQWTYGGATQEILSQQKYKFNVYRIVNEGKPNRVKQSKKQTYQDTNIKDGEIYRYAVQVIFEDGKKGGLSEFVEAKK